MSDAPAEPPAAHDQPPAQDPPADTDWKAEARKWEQRAKQNKAELEAAAPKLAEYDALAAASKTDLERTTEELTRWQTDAETWRKAAISSRVEALAAQDFADPSDAATALTERNYLDAGGQINEQAIRTDLAELLDKKPHWRRQDTSPGPRVPAPNPAQGSGGGKPVADPAQEFAAIIQGQMGSR